MKEDIDSLKPTQFAVGYEEVDRKVKKIQKMKNKELKDYLQIKQVPIIIWKNNKFLIDHHHLCLALYRLGIKKVYVKIIKDYQNIESCQFWKQLHEDGYLWPYDNEGKGISIEHIDLYIPQHIKELEDDPYRAFAGYLRKHNVFIKTNIPFAEFKWANFLRENRVILYNKRKAVEKACLLAQSEEAKHLPGWMPIQIISILDD